MQNNIQKRRKNLNKVIEYMRTYENQLDMLDVYTAPKILSPGSVGDVKEAVESDCGATCCIAGFICCALGETGDYVSMRRAEKLLDLDFNISTILFTPGGSPKTNAHIRKYFPTEHTMLNTNIAVAIRALEVAIELQEQLDAGTNPEEEDNV